MVVSSIRFENLIISSVLSTIGMFQVKQYRLFWIQNDFSNHISCDLRGISFNWNLLSFIEKWIFPQVMHKIFYILLTKFLVKLINLLESKPILWEPQFFILFPILFLFIVLLLCFKRRVRVLLLKQIVSSIMSIDHF